MKRKRGQLGKAKVASHLFLFVLLLLIMSCNKSEVLDTSSTDNGKRVYLTISLGNTNCPPPSTRNSTPSTRNSTPSINTDSTLFEDRVRELVIYIFDSNTGEGIDFRAFKIALNQSASFVVDFPEGTYDFYFIANMPTTGEDASSSLGNKKAAEDYLKKLRALNESLFTGPINDGAEFSLFPMARVYRKQIIKNNSSNSSGSSPHNPIYFRPINEDGVPEDYVLLTRAVAKIETILKGDGANHVASINLINGVNEYSLTTHTENIGKTENKENTIFKESTNSRIIYTPEVIQSTSPQWNDDYTGKDINYFIITFNSGKTRKVPIASNYKKENEPDYWKWISGEKAEFNVLRNNHYQFTLNIPEDTKEIEVEVKVLPWIVVESGMDFGEADYTFELDKNVEEDDKKTILLHQQEQANVTFKLDQPKGALWKATITNGFDFEISPAEGTSGAVGGIADDQKTYEFNIRPRNPYTGTNKYTELYITVNGEEIQLIKGSTEKPGRGSRYVFKQVE